VRSTKGLHAYAHRPTPVAVVDVLPTVACFLQLPLPQATQRERDGVPLLGPAPLAEPQLTAGADSRRLSRTALGLKTEKGKVWATTTNFKAGGTDTYTLLGTVLLGRQRVAFSRAAHPAPLYKIVLEGAHNAVNRWRMPAGAPTP